MKCPKCGAEVAASSRFCTSCGQSMAASQPAPAAVPAAAPAPKPVAAPVPQPQPRPVQQPVQPAYPAQQQPQYSSVNHGGIPAQYKPIGACGYFGLSILFSIPIVGFVFLIVFSFSNSNINRRNYARSFFCGLLVAAILIALLVVLWFIFKDRILDFFNGILGSLGVDSISFDPSVLFGF